MQLRSIRSLLLMACAGYFFMSFAIGVRATGLYNDADSRGAALGGEEVAGSQSVLAAMDANPAALASLPRAEIAATLTGALLNGRFDQPNERAHLQNTDALFGSGAFEIPAPRHWPVHFGLAVIPDFTLETSWHFHDAPGGLGGMTSYGAQDYHSRILSLRTTAAAAVQVTSWLSLGAAAGADYVHNSLKVPYVFQSQPVLAGFKTLLDLDTDNYAPAFDFGAQFRVSSKVTIGLSYRPRTAVSTDGSASGNASAQLHTLGGAFATVDPNFNYIAEVRTELPQRVAAGIEWQALDRLRLVGGIDWVNWSDAFDQLNVHLKGGSNAAINGVVGSDSLTDIVPLNWRDQFVFRSGVEFEILTGLTARAGYSYARSAVPNDTLTPLTGAIFEHTVTAGVGYRWDRYHADLAWQWRLPAAQHIGQSALLDGEYSGTSVTVDAHLLQLTGAIDF